MARRLDLPPGGEARWPYLVVDDRTIAIVGGLAVSVRTEPRFTRDVDLAVADKAVGGTTALGR